MQEVLKKLNFGDREARVYLTLLTEGPCSLRRVALLTKLNRGTAYNTLKLLIERGVVSFYHRDKRQHFIAENPSVLLRDAEHRQHELQVTMQELKDTLPELQVLYNDATDKPKVRYFEGINGVRTILDDILTVLRDAPHKHYSVYSAADLRTFLYECYPKFTEKRIKAGITVDVIALSAGGRLCGLDERKWLPESDPKSNTYIIVYADRTAFITQQKDTVVGVLIENKHIAQTNALLFTALWKKLS